MIYFARWKIILIITICCLGIIFVAPNFLSVKQAQSLPSWLPHKQLSLGLDLQGGSHLLLEVKVDSVLSCNYNSDQKRYQYVNKEI